MFTKWMHHEKLKVLRSLSSLTRWLTPVSGKKRPEWIIHGTRAIFLKPKSKFESESPLLKQKVAEAKFTQKDGNARRWRHHQRLPVSMRLGMRSMTSSRSLPRVRLLLIGRSFLHDTWPSPPHSPLSSSSSESHRKSFQYTVSQIKQSHSYFYGNFGKCSPIATTLTLLHLMINCERGTSKRCHLILYLLPHYLVKRVQLFIYDSFSTQSQTSIVFQCYWRYFWSMHLLFGLNMFSGTCWRHMTWLRYFVSSPAERLAQHWTTRHWRRQLTSGVHDSKRVHLLRAEGGNKHINKKKLATMINIHCK